MDQLRLPSHSTLIHKEECTLCFDNQDGDEGVDVCLTCFNGSCSSQSTHQHSLLHYNKSNHSIFLNLKRRRKAVALIDRDDQPPIKKLAIRAEMSEEEQYDFITVPRRYVVGGVNGESEVIDNGGEMLDSVIAAVLSAQSSAQRSEVKAWEEEMIDCIHTRDAVQLASTPVGATCSHEGCSLASPLWLCLVCGSLGCGRKQYGGAAGGGEGHGVQHYEHTGHPIAVKLGTIEIGGTGDVYCYPCDEARIDPHLSSHLSHFGINVGEMKKTEKSMTELQIEQNLKFDFSMTGADGNDLQPLFGPGLTGLKNLGNSCYLASTLQSIFALPAFQTYYLDAFVSHSTGCSTSSPANCLECQMAKLAEGLLSGRYSVVEEPEQGSGFVPSMTLEEEELVLSVSLSLDHRVNRPNFQLGLKPTMFKSLVGKDHPEFSTMKQQDADEFFKYLLKMLRQSFRSTSSGASAATNLEDPTRQFSFTNETRLQCSECRGVRYGTEEQDSVMIPVEAKEIQVSVASDEQKPDTSAQKDKKYAPVDLEFCIASLMNAVEVDYRCPVCDKNVTAHKTTRFATFPRVLVVHASRFQYINWVPTKIDVPLLVPMNGLITLDSFLGKGVQKDEVELPTVEAASTIDAPVFNAESMESLMAMGFPEIRCKRGLLATGNGGAEEAINWLFEHMEDADIDDPLPAVKAASPSTDPSDPSDDQIAQITDMGFSISQARKALRETDCDIGRAVEWVFSHPDDTGSEEAVESPVTKQGVVYGSSDLPAQYRLKSFISHKGPSVHSGHYVCHVRQSGDGDWVLFNDEKVAKADLGVEELVKYGYLYIFERI